MRKTTREFGLRCDVLPRPTAARSAVGLAVCAALVFLVPRPIFAQPRSVDVVTGPVTEFRDVATRARGPGTVPLETVLPVRGVTIGPIESSQQRGRGYGTVYSEALLDHLVRMGVTWVSLTPFGRIWSLSSTEIYMDFEAPYEASRAALARMIEQAHARGLRVLVVPHLWVWSEVGWRGEIDFPDDDGWREYLRSYRAFVLAWARDAARAGADALSIGVECKSFSGRFGAFWTALISEVRRVFGGWLTYSANWDEAPDVLFWDRLDFVGINAFYPLAQEHGASFETYLEGAARNADAVEELARALEMPVVFVEVGYTTRRDAAVEPWLWPDGMENVAYSEAEQARALEASLRAFLPRPWFGGFFVWRYYANLDDVSQEAIWGFSPHAKAAERVLQDAFAAQWAADLLRAAEDVPIAGLNDDRSEPLGRTAAWWRSTVVP